VGGVGRAAKEFNLGDLDDMSKFDEFASEELDSEGENDGAFCPPPTASGRPLSPGVRCDGAFCPPPTARERETPLP
jgi:hypothetical protein